MDGWTADEEALREWVLSLDAISYYELLRVAPDAPYDHLHAAFQAFCDDFHPDRHAGRTGGERAAVARIYRRGAEAWRILSEPALRARYDEALARGVVRPEDLLFERASSRSLIAAAPTRIVDAVRVARARPFVARAEELLGNGDPRQAKLQLVMAMHIDPDNPALEAFAGRIEAAIAGRSTRRDP
jgi:curved DNA-binding protein CbpA